MNPKFEEMRQWMKIYRSRPTAKGNGTMYFPIKLGTLLANIFQFKNISSSVWYMTLKNISYIQVLVIYLLPTLPTKLKLGLQIGAKLLGPIKLTSQSETWNNQ